MDDRRKYVQPCADLILITQKLNDFMERYERDQIVSKDWREMVTTSLAVQQKFFNKLEMPWRAVLFLLGALIIGIVTAVGPGLINWFRRILKAFF